MEKTKIGGCFCREIMMSKLKKVVAVASTYLVLGLLVGIAGAARAADCQSVQQYRMQSVLEYSGKTQFCNKAETTFTAKGHLLSNGRSRYVLSADEISGIGDRVPSSLKELSFVIDRKTQRLSGTDMTLMEKATNQCVASLKQVSRNNLGTTWKQAFNLSSIGSSVPSEMKFTLTAIPIQTKTHGELIAVRALSEPFFVDITGGTARCKMNCAYVFCSGFEDIFFSASVFGAMTNCNGYAERLKHTVTTWKVDASGQPADIGQLGVNKNFTKLVGKLGVTRNVRVVDAAPLPLWARSDGIRTAQVANLCASVSCEGALNPVATIYMPVASTVGLQGFSESLTLNKIMLGAEGYEVPAATGREGLKWWPPWANIGWNWPTAAWGVGLGFGGAAAGGAFDDDDGDDTVRSPSS
jgi:hypothetical protein